jgi:hypothetical protein
VSKQTSYEEASRTALEAKKKQDNERAKEKAKEEGKKKLSALKAEVNSIDQQLKTVKNLIDNEEFTLNKAKKDYQDYFKLAAPNGLQSELSSGEIAQLASLQQPITVSNNRLTGYKSRRTNLNNTRKDRIKQINDMVGANKRYQADKAKSEKNSTGGPKKPPGTGSGNNTNNKGGAVDPKGPYKYNPPMVKSAYFRNGIASDALGQQTITSPGYVDAKNAWGTGTQSRGAIQMDKKFITKVLKKKDPKGTTFNTFDDQLYGFRFSYNPTTVSMGWQIMTAMNPEFVASGDDEFVPISAGLLSSVVDFTLWLNRIEDMKLLSKEGLVHKNPYPYPRTITAKDERELWKKGTMYDLEYLFKVLNGPHATFKSDMLQGETADRGWLRPAIVELHLGAQMRYKVRIQDFSVNHIMFNSRMVPILSTVKLTCLRFNDSPERKGGAPVGPTNTTGATWTGSPSPTDLQAGGYR